MGAEIRLSGITALEGGDCRFCDKRKREREIRHWNEDRLRINKEGSQVYKITML